jgi:hypothetical protein
MLMQNTCCYNLIHRQVEKPFQGEGQVHVSHLWRCPFGRQDDSSTGKNTCQASSALAVRLSIMYTFSP